MKVCYVSSGYFKSNLSGETRLIDCIIDKAVFDRVDMVILLGNLSKNYIDTLHIIDTLGAKLKEVGISLRFIVGNTDFYYHDPVVNKVERFYEIRGMYNNNKYCLFTHPIITQSLWIIGAETWYDYSLYRGKPVQLRDICKKRKWFISNKDNYYITDKDDYALGLKNTFDYIYTSDCVGNLNTALSRYETKMLSPIHKVIVGYFYPTKILLKDNYIEKYFGTFKGSERFYDILEKHRVTDYISGISARKEVIRYNGIQFISPEGIYEVDYE